MKKIIFILSISLFSIYVQAQTMDQTIQWLNAKAGNIHNPDFAKMYYLKAKGNDAVLIYPQSSSYNDFHHINFSKISGANFVFQNDVYKIRLTGLVDSVRDKEESPYFFNFNKFENNEFLLRYNAYSVIEIWYSVSEEEIKKIKKRRKNK